MYNEEELTEKIKNFFTDVIIDYEDFPITDEYKISLGKDEYSNTAYYYYKPPHNIVIGSKILENVKKNNFNKELIDWYIKSFLVHEYSHALWTEKIETINTLLDVIKIPFHYFNLFEDARIENKFTKLTSRMFKWSYLESFKNEFLEKEYHKLTPLDIYFYFIYTENEILNENVDINLIKNIKERSIFNEIKEFYTRTINSENSIDLIPIIKEFYDKFKNKEDEEHNPSTGFKCEFSLSGVGIEDGKKVEIKSSKKGIKIAVKGDKDDKHTEEIKDKMDLIAAGSDTIIDSTEEYKEEEDKTSYVEEAKKDGDKLEFYDIDFKSGRLISEEIVYSKEDMDEVIKKGEELYNNSLKKIFRKRYNINVDEKFSKTFNITNLVLDRDDIYKHKTTTKNGQRNNKKRKLTLIVDVSGSMGYLAKEVLVVLYVFNRLSQNKIIDFNLILSGGTQRNPENILLQTPLKTKELFKIMFRSGIEGLYYTLIKHEKILQNSEINFVLTDGEIVDVPINKKELNDKGIYTRGIYILKSKHLLKQKEKIETRMNSYFDEFTMKETVEEIFEEIILKYKKL